MDTATKEKIIAFLAEKNTNFEEAREAYDAGDMDQADFSEECGYAQACDDFEEFIKTL